MKIQFREMTVAVKDVEKTKNFYQKLFQNEVKVDHHEFFYTFEDARSKGNMCIVPTNGDAKWENPWLTVSTDDLNASIQYIKDIGVEESTIENFGATTDSNEPLTGVTFRDPDGRLLMMLYDDEI